MYAFACGLIALSDNLARACVIGLVASFVVAVGSYVLHGALRDTDNQFKVPHTLGPVRVHGLIVDVVMGLEGLVELVATVMVSRAPSRAPHPPLHSGSAAVQPTNQLNPSASRRSSATTTCGSSGAACSLSRDSASATIRVADCSTSRPAVVSTVC